MEKYKKYFGFLILFLVGLVVAFFIKKISEVKNENLKSTATLFETPFGFTGQADGSVSLEINITNLKPVLPQMHGFQIANYYEMIAYNKKNPAQYNAQTNTYTPDLIQENWIKELSPKLLRFPGGVAGNNYHIWKSETDTSLSKGFGFRPSDFEYYQQLSGLENFAIGYYGNSQGYLNYQSTLPINFIEPFSAMSKSLKTKTIVVANILSSKPNEVLDFIKYFRTNGVSISSVALGSETYSKERFPFNYSADEYIAKAEPIAKAIKDFDKNIKLTLVAAPYHLSGIANYQNFDNWNTRINFELKNKIYKNNRLYDGVDFHRYTQFNCLGNSNYVEVFNCANQALDFYFKYPTRQDAKNVTGVDLKSRTIPEVFNYLTNKFPGESIYLTEWGVAGWTNLGEIQGISPYSGTIFQGIFNMKFMNYMNKFNSENNYPIKETAVQNIAGYRTYCLICERDTQRGETFVDNPATIYNRTAPYFAHKFLSFISSFALNIGEVNAVFGANPHLDTISTDFTVYAKNNIPGSPTYLYFTNQSDKALAINSVKADGQFIDLNKITESYYVYGNEIYSTRGIGYWNGNQPNGPQAKIVEKEISRLNKFVIPPYSFGVIKFHR